MSEGLQTQLEEDPPVVWVVIWFDPSSGEFGSLDVYASEDSARAASGNARWADVMQYEVHP